MPYVRKTRDEFDIEADYGHGDGWEVVSCEETRRDASRAVREYRENAPEGRYRIRHHRVRKEAQ